jgi:hypothetical protein
MRSPVTKRSPVGFGRGKSRCTISVMITVIGLVLFAAPNLAFAEDENYAEYISDERAEKMMEELPMYFSSELDIEIIQRAIYLIRPNLVSTKRTISKSESRTRDTIEPICGTPILLKAIELLKTKSLDNPFLPKSLQQAPTHLDQHIETEHFRINYSLDPADDDHIADASWAQAIADYMEASYGYEVTDWGYQPGVGPLWPLPSRIEVDLVWSAPSGGTVTLGWVNPFTPWTIHVNTYLEGNYDDTGQFGTCAHEFFHTCQGRYDGLLDAALTNSGWFLEGTAAWMEHEAYIEHFGFDFADDDGRMFRNRVNQYFDGIHLPWDDEHGNAGYPIGAFFYFLADNTQVNFAGAGQSRNIVRNMWEGIGPPLGYLGLGAAIENAFEDASAQYDTFDEAYVTFARATAFIPSWYPTAAQNFDPPERPEMSTVGDASSYQIDSESSTLDEINPISERGSHYFHVEVDEQNEINLEFVGDHASRVFYKLYPNFLMRIYPDGVESDERVVPVVEGRATVTIKATSADITLVRLNDGDLIGGPSGNYRFTLREIPVEREVYVMDFEDGTDKHVIRSSIPGMFFTTTQGYDWIYGDKTTGEYNVDPYGSGSYVCNGNVFAWLGPNQGMGRIDFIGETARTVSMKTSTYSGLFLDAYDRNNNLLDSDFVSQNTNTGRLDELSVSGENIAYILVHDTGNYWLMDDLEVGDLLRTTTPLLSEGFTPSFQTLDLIDQDETITYAYENEGANELELIVNWSGSSLELFALSPEDSAYGRWTSETPPMIVSVPQAAAGLWEFQIKALDIPTNQYPIALVVGATDPAADTTPPLVTILSPVDGHTYSDAVPVMFRFSAEDPETGISDLSALLNGSTVVENGDMVYLDQIGTNTFTVTATNGVGLQASSTVRFSTLDFEWLSPLAEYFPDRTFFRNANSTIPVKFALFDSAGVFLEDLSVRAILEGTNADFTACQFIEREDTCIRVDLEYDEPKYVVNLHTNASHWDYGIMLGDLYPLKVFFGDQLYGSLNIVITSFPVTSPSADDSWLPSSSQEVVWKVPTDAVVESVELFLSIDGGMSWSEVDHVDDGSGIADIQVPDVTTDVAMVMARARSSMGVIHGISGLFSIGDAVTSAQEPRMPSTYALEQNYPNPFNPATVIQYALPVKTSVSLVVYDASGSRVRTLVGEETQGPGAITQTWDGTDDVGRSVSSGVYFYRLTTKDFEQSRKMILLK